MPDDTLIQRLRHGDQESAQEFERLYRARLIRCAESHRVPADSARDLAQDVLFEAIIQIREGGFRGHAELGTWLRRILMNKVADYWRNVEHHRRALAATPPDNPMLLPTGALQMANAPFMVEERVDLDRILSTLPSLHRAILLLHEGEGWTIDEISKRLGRPAGTISRKLMEAKNMLGERVARSGERGSSVLIRTKSSKKTNIRSD